MAGSLDRVIEQLERVMDDGVPDDAFTARDVADATESSVYVIASELRKLVEKGELCSQKSRSKNNPTLYWYPSEDK